MNLLTEKWEQLLENDKVPSIPDPYRKKVTAQLLENQEKFLAEASTTVAGNIQNWDPVLINLVRRLAPKLIAYDVCRSSSNDRSNRSCFCYAFSLYEWCGC